MSNECKQQQVQQITRNHHHQMYAYILPGTPLARHEGYVRIYIYIYIHTYSTGEPQVTVHTL